MSGGGGRAFPARHLAGVRESLQFNDRWADADECGRKSQAEAVVRILKGCLEAWVVLYG